MQPTSHRPIAAQWPSFALVALAACLVTAALLGPLAFGFLEWRISTNSLNQTYGADGAALLLLAPASMIAAWLAWQGRRLAAPLGFGIGLAALYYGVASVLGADYVQYEGNNERFFLLFLAIVTLSWTISAWAWSAMDPEPPRPSRAVARTTAIVLVLGGLAIATAWLIQLGAIAANGALSQPSEVQAYAESPTAFWLVRLVDLGFIVPLALWTGFGLWRGSAAALRAAYGVTAFMTLQAAAVLAMGAIMLIRNDPTATPGLVVVLTPITLALGVLCGRLLASYARGSDRGQAPASAPASASSAPDARSTAWSPHP